MARRNVPSMDDGGCTRRVLIVRHAQAARETPGGGSDRTRPLTEYGERDARLAGGRLLNRSIVPDLLLSSPAHRAARTAEILAECLRYDREAITYELSIYNASRSTLLELLSDTDEAVTSLIIVGHNPGLSELANALSRDPLEGLPTCGIVSLEFPTLEQWADLRPSIGRLDFTDFGRAAD
ncbi:MAG: histidine phosphatase family protein [Pseudomonadota bacterium]